MRKRIDINNPLIKPIIDTYLIKIEEALNVEPRVEQAIVPIYRINKNILKNNNLEQIGTGIIVRIKEQYFVFSASHVFESFGDSQIFIGGGDNNEILQIAGERFSTKKGISETHFDDPIDASVFQMDLPISMKIKNIALTIDDLEQDTQNDKSSIFLVAGFRANKSKKYGNIIYSKPSVYPSTEINSAKYSEYNIDNEIHIALAYDKEVLVNRTWKKAPLLNGLSGGPIIRISTKINPSDNAIIVKKQLLSAIIIEKKESRLSGERILVGCKVYVHLKLIKTFLPELMLD